MNASDAAGDWDEYLPAPEIRLVSAAVAWPLLLALLEDTDRLCRAIRSAERQLAKHYECIGSGSQRSVYGRMGHQVVYKLPLDCASEWESLPDHVWASLDEVFACEQDAHDAQIAPCRLVWHRSGVPIVVMDRVDELCSDDIDDELLGVVDCDQIGWSDLLDRQVIYDAGSGPKSAGYRDSPWRQLLRTRGANRLNEIAGGQLALEIAA